MYKKVCNASCVARSGRIACGVWEHLVDLSDFLGDIFTIFFVLFQPFQVDHIAYDKPFLLEILVYLLVLVTQHLGYVLLYRCQLLKWVRIHHR